MILKETISKKGIVSFCVRIAAKKYQRTIFPEASSAGDAQQPGYTNKCLICIAFSRVVGYNMRGKINFLQVRIK
jgi:hypothetical protein